MEPGFWGGRRGRLCYTLGGTNCGSIFSFFKKQYPTRRHLCILVYSSIKSGSQRAWPSAEPKPGRRVVMLLNRFCANERSRLQLPCSELFIPLKKAIDIEPYLALNKKVTVRWSLQGGACSRTCHLVLRGGRVVAYLRAPFGLLVSIWTVEGDWHVI